MQTGSSFSADERAAMRAYVQRSEVRLSTMHRVAGVFLNGAGLLILLPVLFRDIVQQIVGVLIRYFNESAMLGEWTAIFYILLLFPFGISMYIPVRALYLLLKDLVDFYFVGHSPGYSSRLFNPRFVLSGIAFSPDESPLAKEEIIRTEYRNLRHFVLPFDEYSASYYDQVKKESEDLIIPETRSADRLKELGITSDSGSQDQTSELDRFSVAFGLAGVIDRDLVDEVAKTETSMVRHALSLRRLVLRYAKALLAVVWTTLMSFLIVSIQPAISESILLYAGGYFVWAFLMERVVKLPVKWIFESANKNADQRVTTRDQQLVKFEVEVRWWCIAAGLVSAIVGVFYGVVRFAL